MSRKDRLDQLRKRYGAKSIDNAARLHPKECVDLLGWRDEMDPNFTKLWLDFTYGGLFTRRILSERTRLLVVISQCIGLDEMEMLEIHIRAALESGATPREVLEVILQMTVYLGHFKTHRAGRVFYRLMHELDRMDEITSTQLPLDGHLRGRTLEQERPTWRVPEEKFPRRQELMDKYGWEGISAGLRLQPTHHAQSVEGQDRIDQNFLKMWLDFIYAGMYCRGVLDDKTRVLCMVGVCTALDEMPQNENHIRAALFLGNSPREVLEVCLQSTAYCGMPRSLRAVRMLEAALREQGRLSELTDTQPPMPS